MAVMLPDLQEIKKRRKLAGLTQSGLAGLSGVSQSLIAKIESCRMEPGYAKAKLLFDCLERLHERSEKQAKDIMTKPVLTIDAHEPVKKAIRLLGKNGLSQLPVLSAGRPVGAVSEKSILSWLNAPGRHPDPEKAAVSDVMEESMPTIQENTPLGVVSRLLDFSNCILVVRNGKTTGIITKSDLLKQMIK